MKSCITHWLPLLLKSGVPTPRTEIVETDCELIHLLDGQAPDDFPDFIAALKDACEKVPGPPWFLRTGHTSGKHNWYDTCYLENIESLGQHVYYLEEYSACAGIMGLPTNVWAVREFLKLDVGFRAFRGFPVNRERRYFVEDGEVVCSHPYWPPDSIITPSTEGWKTILDELNSDTENDEKILRALTLQVARHFEGAWSLDWARDVEGKWWAIDMAPAGISWHWPQCRYAGAFDA